jgi:hypothetical protein
MRDRSFSVVALSFASVMVALYAQIGAVPLLLGGSVFASMGSMQGAAALALGALFLSLAIAAYAVAYGTWTRRHWSWSAAVVVLTTLIAVTVMLALLSANLMVAPLPIAGAAVGLWLLSRPAVKAELLGEADAIESRPRTTDGLEVAEGAR